MQSCFGQNRKVVDLVTAASLSLERGKAGWSNVREHAAWITLCILGANGLQWVWSFTKPACTIIRESCYRFSREAMALFPAAGALPRSKPTLIKILAFLPSVTVRLSGVSTASCPTWIHSLVCRIVVLHDETECLSSSWEVAGWFQSQNLAR